MLITIRAFLHVIEQNKTFFKYKDLGKLREYLSRALLKVFTHLNKIKFQPNHLRQISLMRLSPRVPSEQPMTGILTVIYLTALQILSSDYSCCKTGGLMI